MTYIEYFIDFWLPILKRQYFKFKIKGYDMAIMKLENNIMKNWNLTDEEKEEILKEIRGIK